MKILLTLFFLFFSSTTFAEINRKEFLNAYNEGCLNEDPYPLTAGEQFFACGCLTNEVSKQYTLDELMDDDDYTEKEKFMKITDYCVSVILESRQIN